MTVIGFFSPILVVPVDIVTAFMPIDLKFAQYKSDV